MAGGGGPGGGEGPGLGGGQEAVAVGVAAGERGAEVVGGVARSAVVIHDDDTRQRDVAGVRHHVVERHRAAHRHEDPGRHVVVRPVGELDQVDGRGATEVVVD